MNREVMDPIVQKAKISMMSDARLEELITLVLNEAYKQVSSNPNISTSLAASRMMDHFGVEIIPCAS